MYEIFLHGLSQHPAQRNTHNVFVTKKFDSLVLHLFKKKTKEFAVVCIQLFFKKHSCEDALNLLLFPLSFSASFFASSSFTFAATLRSALWRLGPQSSSFLSLFLRFLLRFIIFHFCCNFAFSFVDPPSRSMQPVGFTFFHFYIHVIVQHFHFSTNNILFCL